jgi:hypothetical protein
MITLSGFNLSGLPAGSAINSVKLELKHQDHLVLPSSASVGNLSLSGTVTGTAASATITDKNNCALACLTEADTNHADLADLSAAFTTPASLQNLSVVYSATAKKQGNSGTSFTESLDGARLLINYTPPPPATFLKESGCVTTAPYGSAGSCALITTAGTQTSYSVHGTAYAPLAAFDIQLTNASYEVFGRGLVARSLKANVTSSSTCTGASCIPFQLPGPSGRGPTTVVFLVRVDGNKRLRAQVVFASGLPPAVQSWSVINEP